MELRELRCFLTVAEEKHFGHAADRMSMTQSQVSRLISRLEEELDVKLFERSSRKVQLTRAGESLIEEARATLEAAEQTRRVARHVAEGQHDLLEIATPSTMPFTELFPRVVRSFHRSHPLVQFRIHEMGIRDQIEGLVAHRLDIGFARLPIVRIPQTIDAVTMLTEPLILSLPEDHPLTKLDTIPTASLASEAFILFSSEIGGGLHDLTLEVCMRAGFLPRKAQEAARVPTAVSLVAAGCGITFVPEGFSRMFNPGVAYRPVDDAQAVAQIALLFRKRERVPLVKKFAEAALSWGDRSESIPSSE